MIGVNGVFQVQESLMYVLPKRAWVQESLRVPWKESVRKSLCVYRSIGRNKY